MLDTLVVKGSSKQVYLHTLFWHRECSSIFWLPVVPWVSIKPAQTNPPYVVCFLIHYPRDTGSTKTSKHHLYLPKYKRWWKIGVCCTIQHEVKHVLHEYFPENWILWKGIILYLWKYSVFSTRCRYILVPRLRITEANLPLRPYMPAWHVQGLLLVTFHHCTVYFLNYN